MVYRVFTVSSGPQTVHNLFKLCYLAANAPLLRNHPAGDAVPCVPGRVGLHVVRFGVDHQRRAAITE